MPTYPFLHSHLQVSLMKISFGLHFFVRSHSTKKQFMYYLISYLIIIIKVGIQLLYLYLDYY